MKNWECRMRYTLCSLLPSKRMRASAYLEMLSSSDGFSALRFLYKIAIRDPSERETVLWAYGEYTKMQEIKAIAERSSDIPNTRMVAEVRSMIDNLIAKSVAEERRSIEALKEEPILALA